MKHFVSASLIALAVGAAAVPGSAQDGSAPGGFRLPTPTPTPTDVQGPVDPDAPILTRPRAPTPTPTPRPTAAPAPAPTPEPSPTPRVVRPPSNSSLPPRFTPPATPSPQESEAVVESATPFPGAATESAPAPLPTAASEPAPAGASAVEAPADSSGSGLPAWLYALGGLVLAGGLGAALWFRRRKAADAPPPAIVPPRPASAAEASARRPVTPPAPAPAPVPAGSVLAIDAKAKQLARSMRFATLSYELRLTNRGAIPLENVVFGVDLVTAHARIPASDQLADPAVPLTPVQTVERLDPGESVAFSGEFRLPLEEIRPIPHGKAVVYVPLLRIRAEAAGVAPVARTFVVGLRTPGAERLQPFRLDEMPQVYHAVGQTALD
ncbi:hypothetical protein N0B51_14475 [Tsuneonella sp. YG55]|uniref:LPXTG cell wall anchor domain-containing protein n=1 Tax=Tsuneonella litorea TaxID=2976475 RepID=A0A9X2W521_9SPHN|nr:hypothetical protein [Tsuneonella litorea]MCT2560185.1 hypothetical protein [Tsuneonella litorea]